MSKTGLQLFGDKQLEKVFRGLGDSVQRKVLRGAVNASTTPIVKAAKANAPKESGLLKKSMGKKTKAYKKSGNVVSMVGAKSNVVGEYKGKKRWPAKYSHLVEKGFIDANGAAVPAQPFLRPAFDEKQGEAMGILKDKLAAGVIKEASKAKGKK